MHSLNARRAPGGGTLLLPLGGGGGARAAAQALRMTAVVGLCPAALTTVEPVTQAPCRSGRPVTSETPVGERVFWMTFVLRPWFAPTDFPDLERITVTAFPELPPADHNEIQSVKVVYEFNSDSVPLPLPPDP